MVKKFLIKMEKSRYLQFVLQVTRVKELKLLEAMSYHNFITTNMSEISTIFLGIADRQRF